MGNKTPEGLVKAGICQWLAFRRSRCMFWMNESVGVFDQKLGIYRKKNSPFQRKGISDILGIWDGQALAIEVKAGSNRPSADQIEFLTDFSESGGIAICAWNWRDVEICLQRVERMIVRPPGFLSLKPCAAERE